MKNVIKEKVRGSPCSFPLYDADEYVQFTPSYYTNPLPILDKRRLYSLNESLDITQKLPPTNCLVIFVLGKSYLNDRFSFKIDFMFTWAVGLGVPPSVQFY